MNMTLCMALLMGAAGAEPPQPADETSIPPAAAASNNQFAVDLYGRLAPTDGNLFLSPLSITTALAMTYAGADGATAKEMAAVLHFPPESPQTHEAFGALLSGLAAEDKPYRLDIANALWLQEDYDFLKPFLDTVQEHYDAGLFKVDFKAGDAARGKINAWVEEQTEDKIQDLIPAGALGAQTRLVLTNAIYFKGDWVLAFDKKSTKEDAFHVSASQEVRAPLMHRVARYGYLRGEGFQALSMPYKGDELAMLVLLPDEVGGLPQLEKSLSAEAIAGWLAQLEPREVDVTFPRFKATSQFELARMLESLGMATAFSPAAADFSRMTGAKDLFISAVIHKAYVDVNEEGTEAAAATGVIMKVTAAIPQEKPVFRADHPFLYLIYEKATGAVLFLGRLVDPTAGGE